MRNLLFVALFVVSACSGATSEMWSPDFKVGTPAAINDAQDPNRPRNTNEQICTSEMLRKGECD